MPEAIVVIIDLPLAKAPVTKPRKPDRIEENALDAAPRTVDHAEDAKPTRLANGALNQPIAADAIARMLDHAYDAMAVTLPQAHPATPPIHLNGATAIEKAADPTKMIAFHPDENAPTMLLHTPRTTLSMLENTKLNAPSKTLPGD